MIRWIQELTESPRRNAVSQVNPFRLASALFPSLNQTYQDDSVVSLLQCGLFCCHWSSGHITEDAAREMNLNATASSACWMLVFHQEMGQMSQRCELRSEAPADEKDSAFPSCAFPFCCWGWVQASGSGLKSPTQEAPPQSWFSQSVSSPGVFSIGGFSDSVFLLVLVRSRNQHG